MQSNKVNLFHEHVLIKEKGSKRTPWHQDQGYYCVQGRDNVSIWIPLDKIDINSSMEFILGHINGIKYFYLQNLKVMIMSIKIKNLKKFRY